MSFDLIRHIIRSIGSRFVQLDVAMPATAIFYPPFLFIVIIVLAALVLLIVALFRRHRRKILEQEAARMQAHLAAQLREEDGTGSADPKDEYPRQADKKEGKT